MDTTTKSDTDLVVFGAGLMHTGTESLHKALEILLEAPCYHMASVAENRHHISLWKKAATDGLTIDKWRKLFKGYKAAVDMPTAVFYDKLASAFPDAKVILSVREPHDWYHSIKHTVLKVDDPSHGFPLNTIVFVLPPYQNIQAMRVLVGKYADSENECYTEEEAVVAFYENYVRRVMDIIPPDRLLFYEANDGWEPLCEFLGLPVPDMPYPTDTMTEKSLEWEDIRDFLKGIVYWTTIVVIILFVTHQIYLRQDLVADIFR